MELPQPASSTQDIVESLSLIEFDVESESFYATYDPTRDSASLAVVEVVGTALGREPEALTPLQSVLEMDALDTLTRGSAPGPRNGASITFEYSGFEIAVTSGGVIEATPIDTA